MVSGKADINVGKGVLVAGGVKVSVDVGEVAGVTVLEEVTCCVGVATATLRLQE